MPLSAQSRARMHKARPLRNDAWPARCTRHLLLGAGLIAATACSPDTNGPMASRELGAGRALAQERCSGCHAVDKATAVSPHPDAPPFAEIVRLYPPESLSEALSEGIMVGHEDMPEFRFSDAEVEQLIAYLKSLE